MAPVRPDPMGFVDVLAGILLFYTVSPLPQTVAMGHAVFLLVKGGGSMIEPKVLPLPVYVLGGAADVISAAILFTGKPPLLVGYKEIIAGILFLKGTWTFLGFMQG